MSLPPLKSKDVSGNVVNPATLTLAWPDGMLTKSGITSTVADTRSNYIKYGNAESSTQGWVTYADAAAAPVDGTGGSPTATFTTSTSSPLRGTASYIYTPGALGNGASYAFVIDSADQAAMLTVEFDYSLGGTGYLDAAMQVWIYDVTNNVMIQPAPYTLLNVGVASKFKTQFQTASNSTSYRLIVHQSTAVSTYTLKIDNVKCGATPYSIGAAVSDWISFTPTGSWSTNTTYAGQWRRVGDTAEIAYKVSLTGAPNATTLSLAMPTGLTIDTVKMNSPSNNAAMVGYGRTLDAGVQAYALNVRYDGGATPFGIYSENAGGTYTSDASAQVSNTVPYTFGTGDQVNISVSVPIAGWSSNTATSADSDSRVCAAYVSGTPTGTINASPSEAVFPTVIRDTHGCYSTANGRYIVSVPGWYTLTAALCIQSTVTAGNALGISLWVNGSTAIGQTYIRPVNHTAAENFTASATYYMSAGDYFTVRAYSEGASNSFGTLGVNFMSVIRASGAAQIQASESVNMRYNGITTTTIAATGYNNLVYSTKVYDSHNAYNAATGVYTCPVAGVYQIGGSVQGASNGYEMDVAVNGARHHAIANSMSSATGYSQVKCNAGDTLALGTNNGGSNIAITNNTVYNWITISRIGN